MGLLDKAARIETPRAEQDSGYSTVDEFIRAYQPDGGAFQGIVLAAESGQLSDMARGFGSVYALPGGDCLLLVPAAMDRELLAHRLSGRTRIIHQFAADGIPAALAELRSWL